MIVSDVATTRNCAAPMPPAPAARRAAVHNEAQGGWVLLAPERVFKADAIAVEIVKRCTGEATFEAIVDDLAKTYSTRRASASMTDVTALMRGLADKKLLESGVNADSIAPLDMRRSAFWPS